MAFARILAAQKRIFSGLSFFAIAMLLGALVGCGSSSSTSSSSTGPTPGSPAPATSTPVSVATGDFNGDGKADIAVVNSAANKANNNISIFLSNGDGTFTTGQTIQTASDPVKAVVGDFNGDGKLDLAVICNATGNDAANNVVEILLGKGDGTFTAQPYVLIDTGAFPSDIGVGDFNHDGKLDLIVAERGRQLARVLTGNGDGTFTSGASYALAGASMSLPLALAVGDFNGDGNLDFAVTDYFLSGGSPTFTVMLGKGDGTFTSAAPSVGPASLLGAQGLAIGDFNGDGKLDIIWSASNGPSVLLGNGDGTFSTSKVSVLPAVLGSNGSYGVVVGHFNSNIDHHLDFILADNSNNRLLGLLGNGDGTFAAAATVGATGTSPMGIATGNFRGTGQLDLAVANEASSNVTILLGNGDGTFTPTSTITIPSDPPK